LIAKYDNHLNITLNKSNDNINLTRDENTRDSIIGSLSYKPPLPYKATGNVESMGAFILYFRDRFVELDPLIGSIRRFKNINDFPNNPRY
jgi:hypothetical protein